MNRKFRVALAGNPNCGKTSVFNALTGARQHVGNYPGVTVESKTGEFKLNGMDIELVDIPGVYSLSSASPEEEVVFKELTTTKIDLILNVIDSSIPQRSLYLTTQLAELHFPMLLVFNMSDEARKKGLRFNTRKLSQYFGSPIVQTIGSRPNGVRMLLNQLARSLNELEDHGVPMLSYGSDIDDTIREISDKIDALNVKKYQQIPSRFFAIKLLEHDTAVMRIREFMPVRDEVENQIKHLWNKHAIEADTFMADRRYAMLAGACRDSISIDPRVRRREISDKLDVVLTNQYFGLPLFLLILYATFWLTFTCARPFMSLIEMFFAFLKNTILACWDPGALPLLRDMTTSGIIDGVGGVLVFLPNILFLFFAIAILEDSGYMSRAAFVMDGIMRRFGLQGRSFVPLVLGFGCNVPAIMATRVIESERDRKITILILPLMSCGARLPVYALLIPVFFADYSALVMFLMYLIGVVIALVAARLMKSTLFRGDGEVYLMELPPYRLPTMRSLMFHMWDRGKEYLKKAGTVILAASIILYICNTFPVKKDLSQDYDARIAAVQNGKHAENVRQMMITGIENEKRAEQMEYTVSGRVGHALEPMFRYIGFDWKLATASAGALAAKEIFVSQLGIIYGKGDADPDSLQKQLRENYSKLQAFCIMLFCLLSIPCIATLAVIRRELNSWFWMAVEAVGLFALAYVLTFIVYQAGLLFGFATKLV